MPRSKVTSKFQVTIPKEIREEIGLRAGEEVIVESVSTEEIRVKRFPQVQSPLESLIGVKLFPRHIPVEEIEEKVETS